jgi:hypothetical protein
MTKTNGAVAAAEATVQTATVAVKTTNYARLAALDQLFIAV